jgi:anti-sigma B factor antagonist
LITTSTDWTVGVAVITVIGEVDLLTLPRLHAELDNVLAAGADAVVLDLTHVTFLSSGGLAELVRAAELGERWGEPLRIVVDDKRPVLRPLQITGLDHVLALYPTVDEALGVLD